MLWHYLYWTNLNSKFVKTLNQLFKLTKWLRCIVTTYLYGEFGFVIFTDHMDSINHLFQMHHFSTRSKIRNPYAFLHFQGVEEGCIGNKWVKIQISRLFLTFKSEGSHCVKSVQIRSFFCYLVSLRIQSECGKIRTRKNSEFGHFSRTVTYYRKETCQKHMLKSTIQISSYKILNDLASLAKWYSVCLYTEFF